MKLPAIPSLLEWVEMLDAPPGAPPAPPSFPSPPEIAFLDQSSEVTDEQASLICQWLPEARRALEPYDHVASRLRAVLHKIEGARNDYKRYISRVVAFISPIRRLPNEVLAEIFLMSCIPVMENGAGVATRDTSLMHPVGRTALQLSLVCSRWRSVALGTPEIWSFIDVSSHSHRRLNSIVSLADADMGFNLMGHYASEHAIVQIVKLYLERSQNHPLAITVRCDAPCDHNRSNISPYDLACHALLSQSCHALCGASQRWRSVHLNLPHCAPPSLDDAVGTFDQLIEHDSRYPARELDVPLLEVLDIYPGSLEISFPETPRLHTLSVNATPWGRSRFDETLFRGPALRSLTLRGHAAGDIRKILLQLSPKSKVDVCLEEMFFPDFRGPRPPIYEAPGMKSLSIHCDPNSTLVDSLNSLCLLLTPVSLVELELVHRQNMTLSNMGFSEAWFIDRYFPSESVIEMIRRSRMPLRILKIQNFYLPTDTLLAILGLLPTIEELTLNECTARQDDTEIKEISLEDSDGVEVSIPAERSAFTDETVVPIVISHLTVSTSSNSEHAQATLLPNLRSLSLTFRSTHNPPLCEVQDLVNLVYSRWPPSIHEASSTTSLSENFARHAGSGLQSLEVRLIIDRDTRPGCVEEYREGLRELKSMGLDVVYSVIIFRDMVRRLVSPWSEPPDLVDLE